MFQTPSDHALDDDKGVLAPFWAWLIGGWNKFWDGDSTVWSEGIYLTLRRFLGLLLFIEYQQLSGEKLYESINKFLSIVLSKVRNCMSSNEWKKKLSFGK